MLGKVCFDASFMCLLRFVSFRVNFDDLCCWTQRCGILSRTYLKDNGPILADWSKWIRITFWSCFCSLLTSNWEFSTSCLLYGFINFTQITQFFCHNVRILITLKHIFQLESILCVYLHDILKRLVTKVCFDALFTCLFRSVVFGGHF